jgi:hypothetical protein
MRFSLFPHFIFSVSFVLGYLTWPRCRDPIFIFTIVMFKGGVGVTSHTPRISFSYGDLVHLKSNSLSYIEYIMCKLFIIHNG